jgi:hypothetical protein
VSVRLDWLEGVSFREDGLESCDPLRHLLGSGSGNDLGVQSDSITAAFRRARSIPSPHHGGGVHHRLLNPRQVFATLFQFRHEVLGAAFTVGLGADADPVPKKIPFMLKLIPCLELARIQFPELLLDFIQSAVYIIAGGGINFVFLRLTYRLSAPLGDP